MLLKCRYYLTMVLLLSFFNCKNSTDEESTTTPQDSSIKQNPFPQFKPNTVNYMAKYSYLLPLYRKGKPFSNATGFFIKKNNHLFLISCNHVFTDVNTMLKKIEPAKKYDSLQIWYHTKDNKLGIYNIDVRKISDANTPFFFYERPDIYVYKIDINRLEKNALIYSIEDYIKDIPVKETVPDSIFSFGYPPRILELSGLSGAGLSYFLPSLPVQDDENIDYDGHNVHLTNSYALNGKSEGGLSGSPVFYSYSPNSIIFAGVIFGHSEKQNIVWVVKPKEVMQRLK